MTVEIKKVKGREALKALADGKTLERGYEKIYLMNVFERSLIVSDCGNDEIPHMSNTILFSLNEEYEVIV